MRRFLAVAGTLSTIMAPPLRAQALTKADTSAIRKMAAASGIDTTKAQLRVVGDTGSIWYSPREGYRKGLNLRRKNGQWTSPWVWDEESSAPTPITVPRPPVPKDTNWVDTITVGRLPTGSCEWSKVRLRPGKPGTTTHAAEPRERTCTVVVYNLTTGTEKDPPVMMSFHFVQDHGPTTLPKGSVLNFADTFTVARRADGECDWNKTPPFPRAPKGSSWTTGEIRVKDCWLVMYNVTFPPGFLNPKGGPVKADTTHVRPPR